MFGRSTSGGSDGLFSGSYAHPTSTTRWAGDESLRAMPDEIEWKKSSWPLPRPTCPMMKVEKKWENSPDGDRGSTVPAGRIFLITLPLAYGVVPRSLLLAWGESCC